MMCKSTERSREGQGAHTDGRVTMTAMASAIDEWLSALALEQVAASTFRGFAPLGRRSRTFGGMTMGQALVAAGTGIDIDRHVIRSVHCDFIRAGDPRLPVDFDVVPTSDGRTFATRRVVARQDEATLFNLLARFHSPESGDDFQSSMPTGMPSPTSLVDYPTHIAPHAAKVPDWADGRLPIDVRMIEEGGPTGQRSWVRIGDGSAGEELAASSIDTPVLHACGLLYASDMTLIGSALVPFGRSWTDDGVQIASLDHAMWFHRPFDVDGWLLYDQQVLSVESSRGLALGRMYSADGHLVATVVQDGLVRGASGVDQSSTI
ncbi:MAG: acyl-CoA thioesterase [Ilumatobacteraceae bacterium]